MIVPVAIGDGQKAGEGLSGFSSDSCEKAISFFWAFMNAD